MKNKKLAKRILKIIGNVVFYVFILVLLLFSISNIATKKEDDIPAVFNRGFVNVLTDSMNGEEKGYKVDSFKKDALVFVKLLNDQGRENLKVGDVVVFWHQLHPHEPAIKGFVIHRIIEINGNQIVTQGDNQTTNASITETNNIRSIKAIATGKVEGVGKPIKYLQTPSGFLIFVVGPLLIIVIFEIFILVRHILKRNKEKLELQLQLERDKLKEELLEEIKNKEENNNEI
ncbi:MAG: hypothetical protein GX149_01820 [Acholeplasmataceae bacterium]|nr:hypothetical protein [Acholeplasmataceae bacterium]